MNTSKPITCIIADDERMMRDQLKLKLKEAWPELVILDEAKNGNEALEMVNRLEPDLAFLDIRMPGKTGIEAARGMGDKVHIVFITAYDQYAVEAFEQGAVDYVLKPADVDRLRTTVKRLQEKVHQKEAPTDLAGIISQLAQQMGVQGIAPKAAYLQWIQASIGQELRLIPVEDILFFQSDEKYTRVQTASYEALIRKPVKELVEELDPQLFWQIHRSTIVNSKAIAGVERDMRGRQLVKIKGSHEKLEVSRSYVHLFKQM